MHSHCHGKAQTIPRAMTFACKDSAASEWCRREQLEPSAPALLAHVIICRDAWINDASEESLRVLPRLYCTFPKKAPSKSSESAERMREYLEWRHPRIDLNLLQLAVIFDRKDCVRYLWRPVFTREENYRGKFVVLSITRLYPMCVQLSFKCRKIICSLVVRYEH